jgi:hypothetical protein
MNIHRLTPFVARSRGRLNCHDRVRHRYLPRQFGALIRGSRFSVYIAENRSRPDLTGSWTPLDEEADRDCYRFATKPPRTTSTSAHSKSSPVGEVGSSGVAPGWVLQSICNRQVAGDAEPRLPRRGPRRRQAGLPLTLEESEADPPGPEGRRPLGDPMLMRWGKSSVISRGPPRMAIPGVHESRGLEPRLGGLPSRDLLRTLRRPDPLQARATYELVLPWPQTRVPTREARSYASSSRRCRAISVATATRQTASGPRTCASIRN